MKTAITVLQEMMMKLGEIPEYECIAQSGPHHQATFEYRCVAQGETVTAAARSKKEAKQEVARVMLQRLAERGLNVPPPYNHNTTQPPGQYRILDAPMSSPKKRRLTTSENIEQSPSNLSQQSIDDNKTMFKKVKVHLSASSSGVGSSGVGVATPAAAVDSRSYVALLKELCEEYRLPAVDYDLVGDTGPPHLRHFTIRATIGQHTRLATATTKRAARQAAAETLYTYLRENLRITKDFVEEAALVRAHERAMERYRECREESAARPRLEQLVARYHLGLRDAHDEEQQKLARSALAERESAEIVLSCAVSALQLEAEWVTLERHSGRPLHVVSLAPTAPPLSFAGDTRERAAAAALAYMHRALPDTPDTPAAPAPTDLRA